MGSAPSSTVKIQQDQASKDLNNNNYHSVHSFDEDQYHSAHSHDEDTIDHNSDTATANGDGAISSQSQAKERDTSEILIEDVYQNGNALPAQKSVSFQSAGLDGFDDTGSRETSIHGLSVLQKPSISGLESKGKEDVYKSNGKMKDIELVNLQAQQSISNSQKSIKMVSIPRNIMQGGKRARSLASLCKCGGCDDFMAKITNGMYYGTIILLMFWIVIIPPYFNPGEICGIYGDCAEEVIALLINFFLLVNDKLNESIRVRIFDQGSENKVRIVIYTNESIEESKILINSYIIQEKKVEALFPAKDWLERALNRPKNRLIYLDGTSELSNKRNKSLRDHLKNRLSGLSVAEFTDEAIGSTTIANENYRFFLTRESSKYYNIKLMKKTLFEDITGIPNQNDQSLANNSFREIVSISKSGKQIEWKSRDELELFRRALRDQKKIIYDEITLACENINIQEQQDNQLIVA